MIGKTLGGRYEVLEKIGGGGMAVVYKGRDKLLNRDITIKVLREQFVNEENFIKRFQREAQAVAKLSHPNIVSIYDVGKEDNFHYLVMEYVEGQNLKEIIQKRAPIEPLEAIDYLMQILDALEHAHENQVIHRDIKPHNILVTKSGKVKVTDFGIAQAVSSATLTYTGTMVGSVQYISPEQAKGEVTDTAADIYSSGVVLYELLTGELPFTGDTAISIAIKHIQSDFAPPSELVEGIPPALEAVVLKAMNKDPKERFASAHEMGAALEKVRATLAADLPTQVMDVPTQILHQGEQKKSREPKKEKYNRKPKPTFWILLPVVLAVALGGFWLGMTRFFETGEAEVPALEGKSLAEAEEILSQLNLKYEIGKQVHDGELPEGYIVKQSPKAGELIRRTRPVVLDISLGPELKSVPGVIGLEERQAAVELTNAGFVVSDEHEEVYDEKYPAGVVIAQDPRPETKRPLGTEIKLVISLGPKPKYVAMPDLIGETLEDAQVILDKNGLKLGDVSYEISYEYFNGEVIKQSVKEGHNILQGEKVDLVVSKGPGLAPKTATVELRVENDGEQHQIKIEISDVTGTKTAYDSWHNSGDFIQIPVEYYGQGKLKVLQDGDVIHEEELP